MISNQQKEEYKKIVKELKTTNEIKDKLIYFYPFSENELLQIKDIDEKWIKSNELFIKKLNNIKKLEEEKLDKKTSNILIKFNKKLAIFSQQSKMVWNKKENFVENLDLSKVDSKSQNVINSIINQNEKNGKIKLKNSKLDEIFGSKITQNIDFINNELQSNNLSENEIKTKSTKNKKIIYEKHNYDLFNKIIIRDLEIKKETGEEQLYLTSYYLEGSISMNQNIIAVRAPIFLYPIILKKNDRSNEIKIELDLSRDIVVNNFILQNILKTNSYKYQIKKSPEENIKLMFKDLKYTLNSNLSKFNNLSISEVRSELGFRINKYSILGLFKRFDNSIQKEIEEILLNKNINNMIKSTFSEYDIYTKEKINLIDNNVEKQINDDQNIFYIDKLNFQQIKALKKINDENTNHLTIWGPPGTGKSQTILSIIIDAIMKNKKVAVVAEKKVALDVIYERLNEIKHFSLMITDLNKKSDFYNQIDKTFSFINENKDSFKDFKTINYELDLKNKLNEIEEIELNKKISRFDNKSIIEIIKDIFKYKLEGKTLNYYKEFENEFSGFEYIDYKEAIDISKFIYENYSTPETLKNYINLNKKYINYETFEEIIIDYKLEIDKIIDQINENENNKNTLEVVNQMIFEHKKIKSLSFFKRRKSLKKIIKSTYLKNKKEVKKFNHENELKKLIENEEKLDHSLKSYKRNLNKIENNENDIRSFKNLSEDQIKWIKKIIDFSKKEWFENKFEGDINKVNLVILNFFIKKNILDSKNFKKIQEEIIKWENNLKEIDDLQKQLIEMNKKLVLKNEINKFIENINFNNRFNTIEKMIKAKKHQSILEFIKSNGIEIKKSYPIWLMRPEVLSTLFKNEEKFDIVLVDEASQLFIEQSLPALQHSRKIVVLGDEKQLSPSSFFASKNDDDIDNDEIFYIENDDSLLDFAKTKYPSVMLKNHYRSNYGELIAFSNNIFYNNSLITTNNNNTSKIKPIETIKVKNGIFNNSINIEEANEVIKLLKDISKNKEENNKSIGIITMNNSQKEHLESLILVKREKDLTLNKLIKNSNIFIKSIENVQGDERDIIIFSSTYGYDNQGKLSLRFGPINNLGGENRINVAVTRSKYKMYIVTSIDVFELKGKVKNAKNNGPKVFADFLEYALDPQQWLKNNNKKENEENVVNDIVNENEIINDIYNILSKKIKNNFNYELLINSDKSNFGIDYIVYDPINKKNILGIELDINAYKNSNYARERDLSKIQYLKLRGWEIYRIWTINWFEKREIEINNIINKINKLKNIF